MKVSLAASIERLLSSADGRQKKLSWSGNSPEEERSCHRQDGHNGDPSHPPPSGMDAFLKNAWAKEPGLIVFPLSRAPAITLSPLSPLPSTPS